MKDILNQLGSIDNCYKEADRYEKAISQIKEIVQNI